MRNIQQQQSKHQCFRTRKLRCHQTIIHEHQDKTYCSTPFLSVSSSNKLHFLALLCLFLFSPCGKGETGTLLGLGNCSLSNDDSELSGPGDSSHCKQVFSFQKHDQNLTFCGCDTKLSYRVTKKLWGILIEIKLDYSKFTLECNTKWDSSRAFMIRNPNFSSYLTKVKRIYPQNIS
jgi:hypothetical protein